MEQTTVPTESLPLSARIAAYEQEEKAPPVVAPVVTETVAPEKLAEAEADSTKPDAELSEAGRKLRGSRKDQRAEKIRADNDNLARELQRRQELNALRSDLERSAPAHQPTAGGAPAGTTATTVVDPRDPEPTFEQVQAANPTHPDAYSLWQRQLSAWDRRQEQRAAFAAHAQQQTTQVQQHAVATYQAHAAEERTRYSDFDAVTVPFLEQYANHPYATDIARFLASDPAGAKVLYHVAKHPDAIAQLFDPKSHPLVTLGILKSTVGGTAPKTKTIPSAPNPPSQTTGAGATAAHVDDSDARLTTGERFKLWRAEEAEQRARGMR